MDPLTLLGLVVLSGILLAFYAYLLRWFLRRRSQRRLAEGAEPTEQHDVAPGAPSARVPAIPQDLVDAAAVGEAVLFAGSGLSASAGLPTRDDLLAKIVDIKGESDPAYWAPL